ncbi:hypothetical protein CDAR_32381 [Caerostris darwini]|uniref:Uncharacterized protein n=1 Tax=Caerostris darwini TaxID=1538125 RepID=A0AAV4WLA9_9ARAC|nr:hypothetical protein CDAR_32381 [Caerostris darwini]
MTSVHQMYWDIVFAGGGNLSRRNPPHLVVATRSLPSLDLPPSGRRTPPFNRPLTPLVIPQRSCTCCLHTEVVDSGQRVSRDLPAGIPELLGG